MIPCNTISRIWHWHLTMCKRFPGYPLVFQVVQQVIQRLCQRNDKVIMLEGYRYVHKAHK
ncbi:Telomerase reverse transcriptase [Gossypium arboreum]|uniref:Telomerase reverse transcriptase n=1 Tax=Gossypium arboreum TaxID=29729 RepID=A0A0B0MZM1_GOSAR|nr:Telomerase reverse transcriptase [Gossypium arboreum]